MTAAATTGPAQAPRPASSMPATASTPRPQSRRSMRMSGIGAAAEPLGARSARRSGRGARGSTFADARRLTGEPAEEVELCSADLAMADDLHLVDSRRGEHERSLDSNAVGDAADLERAIQAVRPMQPDHHALEDLNALFAAFHDLHVDADGVSHFHLSAAFTAAAHHPMQLGQASSGPGPAVAT